MIIKAIDAVVKIWNEKNDHQDADRGVILATSLLAYALRRCGSRRDRYCSWQIPGVILSLFMTHMDFSVHIFSSRKLKEELQTTR